MTPKHVMAGRQLARGISRVSRLISVVHDDARRPLGRTVTALLDTGNREIGYHQAISNLLCPRKSLSCSRGHDLYLMINNG